MPNDAQRICPFYDCEKRIPSTMFACLKHWRSMWGEDKIRVRTGYQAYLERRISLEELRGIQADIMRLYDARDREASKETLNKTKET